MRPSIQQVAFAGQGRAIESHDHLSSGAVDFEASDFDDLADAHWLVASQVEDSLEDEVRGVAGRAKGGGVTGLKRQRHEDTGVQECRGDWRRGEAPGGASTSRRTWLDSLEVQGIDGAIQNRSGWFHCPTKLAQRG